MSGDLRLNDGVEIIAEIGVNHNGDPTVAMKLVEAAAAAGASTAKFQVFRTEGLVTRTVGVANYQRSEQTDSQYDLLKKLELHSAVLYKLKEYTETLGMRFLATPDDIDSLDFLVDGLRVERLKIGSGEITNYRFLEQISSRELPMIMSTGMSSLREIHEAVERLGNPTRDALVLLHCTSSYPTALDEANIAAIRMLRREFDYEVGFSDHTLSSIPAVMAVGMGCRVFEKHITLAHDMEGPDHQASANPSEFRQYVEDLSSAALALGDGVKSPTRSEVANIPFVRRRIIAATEILSGTRVLDEHVEFLRAESGAMAESWTGMVGGIALRSIARGSPIEVSHILARETD